MFILQGLYLKNTPYMGFGVFCTNDIQKGQLIEESIMIPINTTDIEIGNNNPHLFTWSDDRKTWAMGTGFAPFYNHSEKPNIVKKGDLINNKLKFIASENIFAGEEIIGKYISSQWRKCFKKNLY